MKKLAKALLICAALLGSVGAIAYNGDPYCGSYENVCICDVNENGELICYNPLG